MRISEAFFISLGILITLIQRTIQDCLIPENKGHGFIHSHRTLGGGNILTYDYFGKLRTYTTAASTATSTIETISYFPGYSHIQGAAFTSDDELMVLMKDKIIKYTISTSTPVDYCPSVPGLGSADYLLRGYMLNLPNSDYVFVEQKFNTATVLAFVSKSNSANCWTNLYLPLSTWQFAKYTTFDIASLAANSARVYYSLKYGYIGFGGILSNAAQGFENVVKNANINETTSNVMIEARNNFIAVSYISNSDFIGKIAFYNLGLTTFYNDYTSNTEFDWLLSHPSTNNIIGFMRPGRICVLAYSLTASVVIDSKSCYNSLSDSAELSWHSNSQFILKKDNTFVLLDYPGISIAQSYNTQPLYSIKENGASVKQYLTYPGSKIRRFDTSTLSFDAGDVLVDHVQQPITITDSTVSFLYVPVQFSKIKKIQISDNSVADTYEPLVDMTQQSGVSPADYKECMMLSISRYFTSTTELLIYYDCYKVTGGARQALIMRYNMADRTADLLEYPRYTDDINIRFSGAVADTMLYSGVSEDLIFLRGVNNSLNSVGSRSPLTFSNSLVSPLVYPPDNYTSIKHITTSTVTYLYPSGTLPRSYILASDGIVQSQQNLGSGGGFNHFYMHVMSRFTNCYSNYINSTEIYCAGDAIMRMDSGHATSSYMAAKIISKEGSRGIFTYDAANDIKYLLTGDTRFKIDQTSCKKNVDNIWSFGTSYYNRDIYCKDEDIFYPSYCFECYAGALRIDDVCIVATLCPEPHYLMPGTTICNRICPAGKFRYINGAVRQCVANCATDAGTFTKFIEDRCTPCTDATEAINGAICECAANHFLNVAGGANTCVESCPEASFRYINGAVRQCVANCATDAGTFTKFIEDRCTPCTDATEAINGAICECAANHYLNAIGGVNVCIASCPAASFRYINGAVRQCVANCATDAGTFTKFIEDRCTPCTDATEAINGAICECAANHFLNVVGGANTCVASCTIYLDHQTQTCVESISDPANTYFGPSDIYCLKTKYLDYTDMKSCTDSCDEYLLLDQIKGEICISNQECKELGYYVDTNIFNSLVCLPSCNIADSKLANTNTHECDLCSYRILKVPPYPGSSICAIACPADTFPDNESSPKECYKTCDLAATPNSFCFTNFEISVRNMTLLHLTSTLRVELGTNLVGIPINNELLVKLIEKSKSIPQRLLNVGDTKEFVFQTPNSPDTILIDISLDSIYSNETYTAIFDCSGWYFDSSNTRYRLTTETLDIERIGSLIEPNTTNTTTYIAVPEPSTSFVTSSQTLTTGGINSAKIVMPVIVSSTASFSGASAFRYTAHTFNRLLIYRAMSFEMDSNNDFRYLKVFDDFTIKINKFVLELFNDGYSDRDKQRVCDNVSERFCHIPIYSNFLMNQLAFLILIVIILIVASALWKVKIKGKSLGYKIIKLGLPTLFFSEQIKFTFSSINNFWGAVDWSFYGLLGSAFSFIFIVGFWALLGSMYVKGNDKRGFIKDVVDSISADFEDKPSARNFFIIDYLIDLLIASSVIIFQSSKKSQLSCCFVVEIFKVVLIVVIRPFKMKYLYIRNGINSMLSMALLLAIGSLMSDPKNEGKSNLVFWMSALLMLSEVALIGGLGIWKFVEFKNSKRKVGFEPAKLSDNDKSVN